MLHFELHDLQSPVFMIICYAYCLNINCNNFTSAVIQSWIIFNCKVWNELMRGAGSANHRCECYMVDGQSIWRLSLPIVARLINYCLPSEAGRWMIGWLQLQSSKIPSFVSVYNTHIYVYIYVQGCDLTIHGLGVLFGLFSLISTLSDLANALGYTMYHDRT